MNKADTAMYEAKQGGRNNFDSIDQRCAHGLQTDNSSNKDLRYAVRRNEFLLHYQPKLGSEQEFVETL